MNEQTAEQIAHDFHVEKIQRLQGEKSRLLYEQARVQRELTLAYDEIRFFEHKFNLSPRTMDY